jgi:hypothetical protein
VPALIFGREKCTVTKRNQNYIHSGNNTLRPRLQYDANATCWLPGGAVSHCQALKDFFPIRVQYPSVKAIKLTYLCCMRCWKWYSCRHTHSLCRLRRLEFTRRNYFSLLMPLVLGSVFQGNLGGIFRRHLLIEPEFTKDSHRKTRRWVVYRTISIHTTMEDTTALVSEYFCRQLLVALGSESCSSCRQPGSSMCVEIRNWTHCYTLDMPQVSLYLIKCKLRYRRRTEDLT